MTRIATANNYTVLAADLLRAQSAKADAGIQVSSGKKGSDLKGFAQDAETISATLAVKSRVDGYVEQGKLLANKLDLQELGLNKIADSAKDSKQAVLDALSSNNGSGLRAQLESTFKAAIDGLNTQYNGQFLFAGGQVDTRPVSATTLSDLTAGPLTNLFHNDSQISTQTLDDTRTIQTGFLANSLATPLFTALQSIQTYLNGIGGNFPNPLTTADVTFLNTQVDTLETARKGLTDVTAQNGQIQASVDQVVADQTNQQTVLLGVVGDLTDVDGVEAASRLKLADAAVQTSALVFSSLKSASLLDYVRF